MNWAIRLDKNLFNKYNGFVTKRNNFVTNKKEIQECLVRF